MKHYLVETVVILALAGIAATGFHKFRSDPQRKLDLADTKRYIDPLKPPPCRDPEKGVRPPVTPAPVAGVKSPEAPVADPPGPAEPVEGEEPGHPVEAAAGVVEIPFEQALEHHQAGTLFLDARRTRHYEEGHIPGARSLPIWEGDFKDKFQAFLNDRNVDPAIPVVVYCMSQNCTDSHMLAAQLKGVGFQDVMVFKGGYPEWVKRSQPIEKGAGGAGAPGGGTDGEKGN